MMNKKELSGDFRKRIRKRELLRVLPRILFVVIIATLGIVVMISLFIEHGFNRQYLPIMLTVAMVFLLLGLNCQTWFGLLFALGRDGATSYRQGICSGLGAETQGNSALFARKNIENNQQYRYYKYQVSAEYEHSKKQEIIVTNKVRYKECKVGEEVYVVSYLIGKNEYLECYANI